MKFPHACFPMKEMGTPSPEGGPLYVCRDCGGQLRLTRPEWFAWFRWWVFDRPTMGDAKAVSGQDRATPR